MRHSIEKPRDFLNSNIKGTFEVLEACKKFKPRHLVIASSSSVYGANEEMPFKENSNSDTPISFYAASKKATESMAYSYSHQFGLNITALRFLLFMVR